MDFCPSLIPTSFFAFCSIKVQEKLTAEFEGSTFAPYTVVACMLLLEGADLYLKNKHAQSPLSISPPDISHVLRTVVQKCG